MFTAGAGDRSALLRSAICERLSQLGVALDADRNAQHADRISSSDGAVTVLVVTAGEEVVIAREAARVLAEVR